MMKSLLLKSIIATCVTGISILMTPKASVAQVNMSFLKEVVESCQKDIFSSEYHQQMGYKGGVNPNSDEADNYLRNCIEARYSYLKVISKLPWLISTGEILPGYPGVVAVTEMAYKITPVYKNTDLLDCLASQDVSSQECTNTNYQLLGLYPKERSHDGKLRMFPEQGKRSSARHSFYAYLCPSCYVSYNNNPSQKIMVEAFQGWFLQLESSQKKELLSILGGKGTAIGYRNNLRAKASEAWREYTGERRRMAEAEQERKRRELLE